MPPELKNYYHSLPSSTVNNSREIIKSTWETLNKKYDSSNRGGADMIAKIMNARFGLGLEADYQERDYGEQRK